MFGYICLMSGIKVIMLIGLGIYYLVKYTSKTADKTQKKRPQPRPVSSQNDGPERSLEDIIKELAGEVAPKPKPVKPVKKGLLQGSKTGILKDHKPVEARVSRTVAERIKKQTRHVEHVEEPEVEYEYDEELTIDLKQAIINEAILVRPHQ